MASQKVTCNFVQKVCWEGGGGIVLRPPARALLNFRVNILTLKTTTAQVVETLVTVNNSPIQDYAHPRDTRTIMLPLLMK